MFWWQCKLSKCWWKHEQYQQEKRRRRRRKRSFLICSPENELSLSPSSSIEPFLCFLQNNHFVLEKRCRTKDSNKSQVKLITHFSFFLFGVKPPPHPPTPTNSFQSPSLVRSMCAITAVCPGLVHFLFHQQHWPLCCALWRHYWSPFCSCQSPTLCCKTNG